MQPVEEELVETPEYYVDSTGLYRANPKFVHESYAVLNADGFRSIPMDTLDAEDRRRILWIGDSFVWGGSAEPLTESFVDRVSRQTDWLGYNTGIPGASPAHYAKAAERFIPELRPDDVVTVFYMSNDVLYEYQEVGPFQSPWYITNAGWLSAYMDGLYFETPQAAYDYYIRRFSIPDTDQKWVNRVCSWTSIGTRIWHLAAWIGWVERYDTEIRANIEAHEKALSPTPVSADYLTRIRELSEQYGARFHLFVIQIHSHLDENIDETHPGLFGELEWQLCPDLERSDYYEWPNGHFKNSGHEKMADFIQEELAKKDH